MALVTTNAGELLLMAAMLNGSPENLLIKLYKNNYTPVATSIASNFTEATFTGYAAVTLTTGGWTTATDGAGAAAASYTSPTFTSSDVTNQDIYGYYIVGATSGTAYWAERYSVTKTIMNGVGLVQVLTITGQSA